MTALATGITTEQLFDEALASAEPLWELRGVVRGLIVDGHDRDLILGDLERFRIVLQRGAASKTRTPSWTLWDVLVGWSSPHMGLEFLSVGRTGSRRWRALV